MRAADWSRHSSATSRWGRARSSVADLLQRPGVAVRVAELGHARVRPALRVQAGSELARPGVDRLLVLDVADLDAVGNQFPMGGLEVVDDEIVGPRGARRRVGQPFAELDRAGRAGWGHLDDAEAVARVIVDVDAEAERSVEGERRVDVADRQSDNFDSVIHHMSRT